MNAMNVATRFLALNCLADVAAAVAALSAVVVVVVDDDDDDDDGAFEIELTLK